ncbi:MAG: hypothetical protein IJ062_10790, partial [Firmicutes bacterium]|nr:hypothetical protein [Bacillota bacterium]
PVTAVRVSWLPSLGELSAAILLAFNTKLQRLTEGFTLAINTPTNSNFTTLFTQQSFFHAAIYAPDNQ